MIRSSTPSGWHQTGISSHKPTCLLYRARTESFGFDLRMLSL